MSEPTPIRVTEVQRITEAGRTVESARIVEYADRPPPAVQPARPGGHGDRAGCDCVMCRSGMRLDWVRPAAPALPPGAAAGDRPALWRRLLGWLR